MIICYQYTNKKDKNLSIFCFKLIFAYKMGFELNQ